MAVGFPETPFQYCIQQIAGFEANEQRLGTMRRRGHVAVAQVVSGTPPALEPRATANLALRLQKLHALSLHRGSPMMVWA